MQNIRRSVPWGLKWEENAIRYGGIAEVVFAHIIQAGLSTMHDLCYNPLKQLLLNFQINNLKLPQIPQMLCVNQKTLEMRAAKQQCGLQRCIPEDCLVTFLFCVGKIVQLRGKDQILSFDGGVHWAQIASFRRFTDFILQNHRTVALTTISFVLQHWPWSSEAANGPDDGIL